MIPRPLVPTTLPPGSSPGVADVWVTANTSRAEPVTTVAGSVTAKTYAASDSGAVTEFALDGKGGYGWPRTLARREGDSPIMAFDGAERVGLFLRREGARRSTRSRCS